MPSKYVLSEEDRQSIAAGKLYDEQKRAEAETRRKERDAKPRARKPAPPAPKPPARPPVPPAQRPSGIIGEKRAVGSVAERERRIREITGMPPPGSQSTDDHQ